ncbi:MAG: lysylphosphatidylglycerol synthase transmembrane domain-containing protein [Candidatus Zixiibacteriota bacterium]
MKGKRGLYIFFGFAISIGLLYLLFRSINFNELVGALKEANYVWLLPNIALVAFGMYQRAYRWRFMLDPIKPVKYNNLIAATCIGFMANNVLPLRLGEFVRAYSLASQDKGITKSASLATIFVERMVFDLVALLLIFGVVIETSHLDLQTDMREGLLVAVGIALIGILFMLLLALRPSQSGEIISRTLFFLPARIRSKVQDLVQKSTRGLEFIRDPKKLWPVAGQTLILWIIMGVSNWFVFQAFGFDLPISASFVLLVVVSVSILIPSSPGFVGVYHVGTVWTLENYHIGRAEALSFALVLHAAQYIPITLMGFYYLRKEHLSLKNLEQEATRAE